MVDGGAAAGPPQPPGGGTAVLFVPGVIQTFALVQSDPPAGRFSSSTRWIGLPASLPRHARGLSSLPCFVFFPTQKNDGGSGQNISPRFNLIQELRINLLLSLS